MAPQTSPVAEFGRIVQSVKLFVVFRCLSVVVMIEYYSPHSGADTRWPG